MFKSDERHRVPEVIISPLSYSRNITGLAVLRLSEPGEHEVRDPFKTRQIVANLTRLIESARVISGLGEAAATKTSKNTSCRRKPIGR
jgi:hypothetical protein